MRRRPPARINWRVRQQVPDALWDAVRGLLPEEPPKPAGGRPRVPDRAALAGLLFVLRNRISWTRLPLRLGFGSGMTCWRRLREWQETGAWPELRATLEQWLEDGAQIEWRRCDAQGEVARRERRPRARRDERGTAA